MTEQQAGKVQRVYKESQVMWVPQVQSELPAHKVLPEMMGQQVCKELQVMLVLQVKLALQEALVQQAL